MVSLLTGSEQSLCPKSSGKGDYSMEKYLHLISIGTREKMLEIWADTGTYSLLFRYSSCVIFILLENQFSIYFVNISDSRKKLNIGYMHRLLSPLAGGHQVVPF